jgi:hypothetical protein
MKEECSPMKALVVVCLSLALFSFPACNSSLSRGKVSSLINANPEVLGAPTTFDIDTTYTLLDKVWSSDELNNNQPGHFDSLPKGSYPDSKFAYCLSHAHLLSIVSLQNTTKIFQVQSAVGYPYVTTPVSHPAALLQYGPQSNPNIVLVPKRVYQNVLGVTTEAEKITFTLFRPKLDDVTGIVQQGENAAAADVIFHYEPTDVYQPFIGCYNNLWASDHDPRNDDPRDTQFAFWYNTNSRIAPIKAQFNTKQHVALTFTKYDDGWRLDKK